MTQKNLLAPVVRIREPVLPKEDGTFDLNEGYQAILAQDSRLSEADIPHELKRCFDGWIVAYPSCDNKRGDVVSHHFSIGARYDLMELMGFKRPDVTGDLSVDEAFEIFREEHEKEVQRHAARKKR